MLKLLKKNKHILISASITSFIIQLKFNPDFYEVVRGFIIDIILYLIGF